MEKLGFCASYIGFGNFFENGFSILGILEIRIFEEKKEEFCGVFLCGCFLKWNLGFRAEKDFTFFSFYFFWML